ncbi:hypothetical protein GCM10027271_43020 [Saccharopolyspora gloriosae]
MGSSVVRSVRAVVVAVVLAAGFGTVPAHAGDVPEARELPEPPVAEVVRGELAGLTVEAPHPMTGYSRDRFPHWVMQNGACDTRETVLARDGRGVVADERCRAVSGNWVSVYDGLEVTSARVGH